MSNKILVIEDNAEVRENIQEILELSNYEVVTAENGKRGVEKAKSENPDLIICDIMMPELDGYGVLYMLGKDTETAGIPFIFLTAKTEKSDFRKGMNLGADDYLTKPFEEMDLLNTIERRLNKSKMFVQKSKDIHQFIDAARGLEELQKLQENKKAKPLKKKDTLFSQGDYPSGVYYVSKGKIKTSVMNNEGKEFITGLFKEGDFIGYLPILEDNDYADTATAMEDSEVLKIPREDFLDLLRKNRDVAHQFIKMLSGNIIDKEKQLLNMAYNTVRKRIADALVELHDKYKKENEKSFSIAIPRNDLASMVGTSTETVTRTLSEFKEDNYLNIKGSEVTITNYEGLKKIRW